MTKKRNTLTYRTEQLEEKVKSMEKKLDDIRTNDLPHLVEKIGNIEGDVKSLKTRIDLLTLFNVGAVIVGLLFAKFF